MRFGADHAYFYRGCFELAFGFQLVALWGPTMLNEEFKKQRAKTVRELAEKVIDPFIKRRLYDLAGRYEGDGAAQV